MNFNTMYTSILWPFPVWKNREKKWNPMHCPSVSLKIDFICHDVVSYETAQKIFFPDVKDLHPFFPCKCNFYIYKYCPIFPPQSTADTPHQLYIPHQPFLYPLWFNMLPSLSPKMLLLPLLAILALSLMDMPAAYEARRIPPWRRTKSDEEKKPVARVIGCARPTPSNICVHVQSPRSLSLSTFLFFLLF